MRKSTPFRKTVVVATLAFSSIRCSGTISSTHADASAPHDVRPPLTDVLSETPRPDSRTEDRAQVDSSSRQPCRYMGQATTPEPIQVYLNSALLNSPESLGSDTTQTQMVWVLDAGNSSPFNRRFYGETETFSEIQRNYVDTGRLRIGLRHMPLQFHPDTEPNASAIVCVGQQGQAFGLVDKLLTQYRPEDVSVIDYLTDFVRSVGLDTSTFLECFTSEATRLRVQADYSAAADAGVVGVPTFIIHNTATGRCAYIPGAYPYSYFPSAIDWVEGR